MDSFDESEVIDLEKERLEVEKSGSNHKIKFDASRLSSSTPKGEETTHPMNLRPADEPLAARVFSRANLGFVTLFLPSPSSQHKRQDDVAHTVRLNIGRVYLKFVIQALLYLLSTYIFISAVKLFSSYPAAARHGRPKAEARSPR